MFIGLCNVYRHSKGMTNDKNEILTHLLSYKNCKFKTVYVLIMCVFEFQCVKFLLTEYISNSYSD